MKRMMWLAVACLLSGLMVAGIVGGLRGSARAAGVGDPSVDALDVVINEVAWMGTAASPSDEWVELYNNTDSPIDIENWSIYGADTGECLNYFDADDFTTTTIPAHGYLIYANHEDDVRDSNGANIVDIWDATIGMNNTSPGQIILYDAPDCGGDAIDTANQVTGNWFAGDSGNTRTMERKNPTASGTDESNWATNDPGIARNGLDANGNAINGTPKAQSSCYQPPAGDIADLNIAKTGPDMTTPGSLITYYITLGNVGSITATAVRITDTLPTAVDFVAQISPFAFSRTGGTLVWEMEDVATGTRHFITVTGRVAGTAATTLTLTNRVTATTIASETAMANNTDSWETAIGAVGEPQVLISGVLYDGYQPDDTDEAIQLVNVGDAPANLTGWELCKDTSSGLSCRALPPTIISSTACMWLAREAISFTVSFGFTPDYEMDSWLSSGLSNKGDEVVLRNNLGNVVDALVYEGGNTNIVGWSNGAVQPYSVGRAEGQILYRIPDEATGLPTTDTNTAADWIQYTGNVTYGRRVLYPGWDLNPLFWPLTATEPATVVVGITPDNGFGVISQTIARAQRTISIEVYSLRNPDVVAALLHKAQEGVGVTILLEGGQTGVSSSDPRWQQELWACQQIEASGGQCWFMIHETGDDIFNRYDYLHAKFIIVDDEWLVVGSQNLTEGSLPSDDKSNGTSGSRGVVLATNAPTMVARAAEVFARDLAPAHHNDVLRWNTAYVNEYGPPDPAYTPVLTTSDHVTYAVRFADPLTVSDTFDFELFTAPEAALRQSDALLGLVARADAGDTIYVEQLYEHVDWGSNPADDPNLRLEAYIAAARRGAAVRILLNGGIFDQPFHQSTNTNTVAYVNQIASAEGLDLEAAIGDPTEYGIHNKMVLVWLDGEGGYAHVGSINGSEGSNKVNREMALQVKSDAVYHYLARVFETDWWLSHPVFLPLVTRSYAAPEPPVDYVVISEVMYRPYVGDPPGNREWVELYNPTNHPIDLSNWSLGDAKAPDEYGSGTYNFPAGTEIPAQGTVVVAQQAADVTFTPDFEFVIDPGRDDLAVPNMNPTGAWDGFGLILGNSGDETILRNDTGADVDIVVWDDPADDPIVKGSYPGVTPWQGMVKSDWSLERRPPYYDTNDCSTDFSPRYPSTPGSVPLP